MNTKTTTATIFAALLVALGLTACGSNDVPAASEAPSEPSVEVVEVQEEVEMTTSQENAVRNAETMMDVSAWSKDGLIRQLSEFNGFETADAEFAVNQLDVDWDAEAIRSAERHLEFTGYSASGMYELLHDFERFTPEQAEAAVAHLGL